VKLNSLVISNVQNDVEWIQWFCSVFVHVSVYDAGLTLLDGASQVSFALVTHPVFALLANLFTSQTIILNYFIIFAAQLL